MNRFPRSPHGLAFVLVAAALWLGGAYFCCHASLERVLLELEESRYWQQVQQEEDRRGEEIEVKQRQFHARMQTKDHICRELVEGHLTLTQATRQVAALPDAPPGFWQELRHSEKGDTDEERLYWHVIDWACVLVGDEPARAAALRRRLEAELQENLHGQ